VAKWDSKHQKMPSDDLVRDFSVLRVFTRVAFLIGEQSDVILLEQRGFKVDSTRQYDAAADYQVIEFNKKIIDAVNMVLRKKESRREVVWNLLEYGLVVCESPKLIQALSNHANLENYFEAMPMGKTPIVPPPRFEESPLYNTLKDLKRNPVIEDTLLSVSGDQIYENARFLSESYYSRQSASTGLREAQQYIASLFAAYGMNVTTQNYFENYAENVCGDFLGSENPEALVIAGAHMDSRSTNSGDPAVRAPGAVDNGSGAAAMMEMARILSATRVQLKNTVRLCLWSGEEQGLLGSQAYVRQLTNENSQVLAYFNADMLGYKLPTSPITLGMKDSSVTAWLLTLSFQITEQYVPDLPVDYSSSCCSDYISFYNVGYPSIGYFQNPATASDYPDYHRSTDTNENNNVLQLELETKAILAAVMTFAETVAY